ncbi:hypothetical protein ABK040_010661 [Willaertia magna]
MSILSWFQGISLFSNSQSDNSTDNNNKFGNNNLLVNNTVGNNYTDVNGENELLKDRYNIILKQATVSDPSRCINRLRELIVLKGIPLDSFEQQERIVLSTEPISCSLRGKIWKAFLRIKHIDGEHYIHLVEKGSHAEEYGGLMKDIDRTLSFFPHLKRKELSKERKDKLQEVLYKKMKRIINCFLLTHGYISFKQGMSTICTFLLFYMSEVDAYFTYERLLTRVFPTYVHHSESDDLEKEVKGIEGVYAACILVDRMILNLDGELFKCLQKANFPARIWGFPLISSIMCHLFDSQKVVIFWDFFFALGFHMIVPVVYSIIKLKRNEIFKLEKEYKDDPIQLQAKLIGFSHTKLVSETDPFEVITEACNSITKITSDFYKDIEDHLEDIDLCLRICSQPIISKEKNVKLRK